MKAKKLTLDIETLAELTPEDARQVNGGAGGKVSSVLAPGGTVSSVMPSPATGYKPTPPVHKHHRHHHH